MSGTLQDAVAVVTGGMSGIGRASARALARLGARVVVADLDKTPAAGGPPTDTVIIRDGGQAVYHRTDVGSEREVTDLFAAVADLWGPVDVLVNSAGAFPTVASSLDMDLAEWERQVRTNLTGTWLCCREALRGMVSRGHGKIVNIGSRLGLTGGSTGRAAYCASKGGVTNLTRQLAVEFGPAGVSVNCVCPGFIPDTGNAITRRPELKARAEQRTPYSRLGTVEDVAAAVVFLAGPDSDFINGQNLAVDGGSLVMP